MTKGVGKPRPLLLLTRKYSTKLSPTTFLSA
nr:MAG TPA: hypothetical protein [Caudoviricetes sp.]DAQ38681.1 MAG TPA: hypothetical protein [Caudoviricetes sp.]